jgi:hypothetical protein
MTPTPQLGIFDAAESERRKRKGMARAEHAAPEEWKNAAMGALLYVARSRREFLVDDVWPHVATDIAPPNARAMGAVMRAGVRKGWIESTGRMAPTSRTTSHRGPRTLWRSLVWEGRHDD